MHWLLALALLAQAAIPLQAHTRLASAHSGEIVVVCTLAGPRSERLGGDEPDTDPTTTLSPALLYSQLLGAAALDTACPVASPNWTLLPAPRAEGRGAAPGTRLSTQPIRGPPVPNRIA